MPTPTFRQTNSLLNERQAQEQTRQQASLKRRRRRRSRLLRAVAALAIAAGVFVGAFAGLGPVRFSNWQDAWRLLGRQGSGFPLPFGYANLQQAALAGDCLALLGPTTFEMHSRSGYEALSVPQPYVNPALRAQGGRALLYDRDSGKLTLFGKTGELYNVELEQDIFCADLNDKGYIAVGTQAEIASSEIRVWDTRQRQRFAWSCEQEYPSALRLSASGRAIALCLMGTEQAAVYARFVEFPLDKKKPRIDVRLPGTWLYGAAEISGGWLAVGDQAAYLFKRGAKEPQALSYEGRALVGFDVGEKYCAALLQDWDNRWLLRVYDRNGALVLEQNFAQQPLGVRCLGGNVYLRFAQRLVRWQRTTGFRQSQELPQGTQEAFVAGREAYLLTLRSVELMRLKWTAAVL